MDRHCDSRDFFLVSGVAESRPVRHHRAWVALAIMGAMVTAMAADPYIGLGIFTISLVAAGLMGLTRCLSAERARKSLDLPVLIAIAAALGIGQAMERTGLAAGLAGYALPLFEPLGPWGVLAGVYALTLVLTELVTNNAAAALAFPIAHAVAVGLGVNFMPFAVAIAIAASAGFATPLGYQTHLMVYGPGGYRFSDFLRIGIPLDLLAMAITVLLAPVVYPF